MGGGVGGIADLWLDSGAEALPRWRGLARDDAEFSAARLPGREAEYFWVGATVMLGQGLAEGAGPVGDGATADLAARDRQVGNGDREAAGMCLAHVLP